MLSQQDKNVLRCIMGASAEQREIRKLQVFIRATGQEMSLHDIRGSITRLQKEGYIVPVVIYNVTDRGMEIIDE